MVREFPRVPTVALLTQLDRATPLAMLSLGSTGLRQVVGCVAIRRDGGSCATTCSHLKAMEFSALPWPAWRSISPAAPQTVSHFFEALFLIPPLYPPSAHRHYLDVTSEYADESASSDRTFRRQSSIWPARVSFERQTVRESRVFSRQRRQSSRLLIAAELRRHVRGS
jgi:hypothetical protein